MKIVHGEALCLLEDQKNEKKLATQGETLTSENLGSDE